MLKKAPERVDVINCCRQTGDEGLHGRQRYLRTGRRVDALFPGRWFDLHGRVCAFAGYRDDGQTAKWERRILKRPCCF